MYGYLLKNKISKDNLGQYILDVKFLDPFVFKADETVAKNSDSLFSNVYADYSRAVNRRSLQGVISALGSAYCTFNSAAVFGGSVPKGSLTKHVISEGSLYCVYKGKDILMNKPSEYPFKIRYLMYNGPDSVFFGGSSVIERLNLVTKFIDNIDLRSCIARDKTFVSEYLSSLSIQLKSPLDFKACAEMISNVYCGLYSAHALLSKHARHVLTEITDYNATQLIGAMHCLAIPLMEYFSFPDGFKETEYHQDLLQCALILSNYSIDGLERNYFSYAFCADFMNRITSRISALLNLGVPTQNIKMCNDIKLLLMKWSL